MNRVLLLLPLLLPLSCSSPTNSESPEATGGSSSASPETIPLDQQLTRASDNTIRFATFNVSLYRETKEGLANDLADANNPQAKKIAEILQIVRPDVVLINEFDYQPSGIAARLFAKNFLNVGQQGQPAIDFPYSYSGPVNTGEPSGMDLDGDSSLSGPADAFGYGRFPGQYGMLVLSQFPIDFAKVRTFQRFLWRDMPGAMIPTRASGQSFYSDEAMEAFRLSSKSHWDLPLQIGTQTVHLLASHPTPPVFDGPEDRNGKRNHDEIRLWADYIDPTKNGYLYDDDGQRGGLDDGAAFVIVGDQNADPLDGDSVNSAITQLVNHPLIQDAPVPSSRGAKQASERQGGKSPSHQGDPAHHTADFSDESVGNLRVDYVLVSKSLQRSGAGVFWPLEDEDMHRLIDASDHRLVWVDVELSRAP